VKGAMSMNDLIEGIFRHKRLRGAASRYVSRSKEVELTKRHVAERMHERFPDADGDEIMGAVNAAFKRFER